MPSKAELNTSHLVQPHPLKMLLVEDSTLLREVLFETINNLKHVSVDGTAATQQKAIELLNKTEFDILLLDIELADRFQQQEGRRESFGPAHYSSTLTGVTSVRKHRATGI